MTDPTITDETDQTTLEETTPEPTPLYGVGPFTIRELSLLGVWLVAFVVSFFPLYTNVMGALGGGMSVWTIGLEWILTIGVPTVAVFLIVLRRFSPSGIRMVGSLGVDQFASVAFSVSATVWLVALWSDVSVVIAQGVWVRTWVVWVEFVLMLAGVVLTVAAPYIPVLSDDFAERREIPAHRNARPVREVVARPAPEPKPQPEPVAYADEVTAATAAQEQVPAAESDVYAPQTDTGAYRALGFDDSGAHTPLAAAESSAAEPQYARSATAEAEPVRTHQAFWALAPEERDVHDEHGVPIFRIGPAAWALIIEDRGELFVVRHEDGRIGYLHDVTGVTRG